MDSEFPELTGFEEWLKESGVIALHPKARQDLMDAFFAGINWSRKNESGWVDVYGEYHSATKPDQDVMDWFAGVGKYGQRPEVVQNEATR